MDKLKYIIYSLDDKLHHYGVHSRVYYCHYKYCDSFLINFGYSSDSMTECDGHKCKKECNNNEHVLCYKVCYCDDHIYRDSMNKKNYCIKCKENNVTFL